MTPTYNAQANPHLGAPGITTMHGDAQSSDATPLAGPGAGNWKITGTKLGGACPTILAGRDGFIQVLCTQVFAHGEFITPKLSILDPYTGRELSHLDIPKGALLGGVYAYLDAQDRMVLVDGSQCLPRLSHSEPHARPERQRRCGWSGARLVRSHLGCDEERLHRGD